MVHGRNLDNFGWPVGVQVAVEYDIEDAAVRHAWEVLSGKDWDESARGITRPPWVSGVFLNEKIHPWRLTTGT